MKTTSSCRTRTWMSVSTCAPIPRPPMGTFPSWRCRWRTGSSDHSPSVGTHSTGRKVSGWLVFVSLFVGGVSRRLFSFSSGSEKMFEATCVKKSSVNYCIILLIAIHTCVRTYIQYNI